MIIILIMKTLHKKKINHLLFKICLLFIFFRIFKKILAEFMLIAVPNKTFLFKNYVELEK